MPTLVFVLLGWGPSIAHAQLAPEIGYVFPPGGQAGTTIDVRLGGYDWTPDMQLFVHDPRIKLELLGSPTEVLVPDPPYWFGAKARGPAWPLPREFPARLTIPADVSPGLIRWQVANANGASPAGVFHVGGAPEVAEDVRRTSPQLLPALPVTVNGQIGRIEEVDEYELHSAKAGPVTIQLLTRHLGSPLHAVIEVKDAEGRMLVDAADTEGRDLTLTFSAAADKTYRLRLHDLDYAGDRSYVYRLLIAHGPQVLAAFPAAGRRGETRQVEFVGIGLATGAAQLERVSRALTFPMTPDEAAYGYRVETPAGTTSPYVFLLSDIPELVKASATGETPLTEVPCAVTAAFETRFCVDRYAAAFRKDDKWRITAQSRSAAARLDLDLTLIGPDGQEVATNDDTAGTTDAAIAFVAPADGTYRLVVTDRSGRSGSPATCYRLSIERQVEDCSFTLPAQLSIPLGGQAMLTMQVARVGGHRGPIAVTLTGLPEGVQAPPDLLVPADKSELAIDLRSVANAPAAAALCRVTVSATLNERAVARQAGTVLLATIMKPRCKITPEGLDDVRKIQRGSTYLAPLLIERLEGYEGEIVLEMTSKQQRHRQGLASGELTIPPGAKRIEYPIFVPEWMETTKTSRMILNGVVRTADPKGNLRTLVQRQEMRIGILPEGALMKLGHTAGEPAVEIGGELRIPLVVSRTPEFREPVRIELVPGEDAPGLATAEPLTLSGEAGTGVLHLRLARDMRLCGERALVIRATALKDGRWPVVSQTTVVVDIRPPD